MAKLPKKPETTTEGITWEELENLRRKARSYLRDPKLKKLAKDLQQDVLTVMLIDKVLGQETWRTSDRVSADARGRFTKMAEALGKDIERIAEGDEGLEDILKGEG